MRASIVFVIQLMFLQSLLEAFAAVTLVLRLTYRRVAGQQPHLAIILYILLEGSESLLA